MLILVGALEGWETIFIFEEDGLVEGDCELLRVIAESLALPCPVPGEEICGRKLIAVARRGLYFECDLPNKIYRKR
jgi:hypothetical protein